jgi:hypothetical protein
MLPGAPDMPHKRAQDILFGTYWSLHGWRHSPSTSPEDFEYAKRSGVMFDPLRATHDEIIARAISTARTTEKRQVADAFLASLTTRRLDLRSALGSFAVLQFFPDHGASSGEQQCTICGLYNRSDKVHDLNVLNFERLKWGGVRHSQPLYAALDLELFASTDVPVPSDRDRQTFCAIVDAIRRVSGDTTSAALQKHLAMLFKSNKAEREILIGILGLCGILETAAHSGYADGFVQYNQRELPARRFIDMAYPACWWAGANGVNDRALNDFFGHAI